MNLIEINSENQSLIFSSQKLDKKFNFKISTSKYGLGQIIDSLKTPLGKHIIYQKIGFDCPKGAIFKARKFTGKIYQPKDQGNFKNQDLILSRILWLSGLEKGFNQGVGQGNLKSFKVDTQERFIYIHGTNHTDLLGLASSNGCIRMCCDDLIFLFDQLEIGDKVCIN